MAWNIEKQNQLDQLLKEHADYKRDEYPVLLDWFNINCGNGFDEHMLNGMINHATEIIEKLKPFSRISTK